MTSLRRTLSPGIALCTALLWSACQDSSPSPGERPTPEPKPGETIPGDQAEDFLSHIPGRSSDNVSDGGLGAAPATDGEGASDSAERAIAEADILQRAGDTLYALSRYAGLTVIDIADPARLRLLGSYRANAEPFEMYLREGVAYIMYNGYGRYEVDAESGRWEYRSSSTVLALDVSDAANIRRIGAHDVPGQVSDSRLVGDVMYLVTYENGYCWDCDAKPNTRVSSFDIHDPAHFEKIDEVRFEDQQGWSPRSISVTSERIYVAGPTWSDRDSNIQIVDIHDPAGDLVLGATIPLHGSIESRWQMDELDGVLRVISQPTTWRSNDPPHVQTFRIQSSSQVTPLANLAMKLPRIEDLRSVRFDGQRAYAVTFEQTDPLFTFDLSDPAQPKQVGELEIPGFVHHMEPRGDRMYTLGFDWAGEAGSLHVSIFDVSVLAAPRMLDRVNFGGDWGSFAEDQDRIQKAFNILLDQGLILVPFSGGSYDEGRCNYKYQSGIQLVDVAGDDLRLRGVAPQVGSARRAFMHREHLFGITDNAVSVFEISDRDRPQATTQLEVARNISQVHVMGDTLLRFGTDWWTSRSLLDFTTLDAAQGAEPLGEIELSSVLPDESKQCGSWSSWGDGVYVHGETAYVARNGSHSSQTGGAYTHEQTMSLYIIDLTERSAPRLVGKLDVAPARDGAFLGEVVLTDHALLVGRGQGYYSYHPDTGERARTSYAYDIYDLADPQQPRLTKRFEVPSALARGGWGWGAIGCGIDMPWGFWFPGTGSTSALVSGDLVVSQHEEKVDDGTGRVRYYLDRLDVSDPSAPKLLEPINIPGQVVHFDGVGQRLITLDYLYEEHAGTSWEACYKQDPRSWFDGKKCRSYARRANALVIDGNKARRLSMLDLDTDERTSQSVAISGQRLFYLSQEVRPYDASYTPSKARLEALSFTAGGQFVRLPSVDLESGDSWGQLYARDARAFVTGSGALTAIDTRDPAVTQAKRHDLQGWGCSSLEVSGERAFCALGQYGVFSVDLAAP